MRRLLIGLAVAILASALVLAVVKLPMAEIRQALASADRAALAFALLAAGAVYPLWVLQWQLIARPLARTGWVAMTQVVAVSVAARFSISGIGGVASAGAALYLRAGLSPAGATSVMAVDQALAGMAKLAALALALAIAPLPEGAKGAILSALVGLALFVGAALGLRRLRGTMPGPGGGYWRRARAAFGRFAGDFERLATWRVLLPAGVLALMKKSLEVIAALAIQRAFGIAGEPLLALTAVISVSLVSLLPIVPMQLGPMALAVFSTYAAQGVPAVEALPIALTHQVLALVTTLALVVLALSLQAMGAGARSRARGESPPA